MYSRVATATIRGIQSVPVCVEADVSDGMPVFEMVGFLASEVKEARERVRTALRNVGCAAAAQNYREFYAGGHPQIRSRV